MRSTNLRVCAFLAGLALAIGPAASQASAAGPHLHISQGDLSGELVAPGAVARYRGIPFAAPPVGDGRWRPPAAPTAWSGVRDATRFGPACMQPKSVPGSFYADDPTEISEDCLYLNVWTPASAAKAPVMVWIHGGALLNGTASSERYDGARLAARGVVVVTINYRMGVFGYFAHPELIAESPRGAAGNYGVQDQIAALRWVRDNIAAFGGDPGNVTIFGESAGALSVSHLMVSPAARGLFHRAIGESPYLPSIPELKRARFGQPPAEAQGAAFAVGAGAAALPALRALPADELMAASQRLAFATQATVDGWILPTQVFEAFEAGAEAPVPLIMGFNSGEFRAFVTIPDVVPPVPASPKAYEAEVRRRYGDLADAYLRAYPAATPHESVLAAARDGLFGWAAERMARQHSQRAPSYLYYFDHSYPGAEQRAVVSFHSAEIPFVFGEVGPGARAPRNWPTPPARAKDLQLSNVMMDYWVSFARTGFPASAKAPAWRALSDGSSYMAFRNGGAAPRVQLRPGSFALHERVVMDRRAQDRGWYMDVGLAAPERPLQTREVAESPDLP